MIGPLLAVAGLGAFHGINPGMGWLFAAALGFQERRARAVWRGLAALTTGHALAIGAAILVGGVARTMVSDAAIRLTVAALLMAMGAARLVRAWHPRGGGMRVGFTGLVGWSFLMASAHGAGLMVLPFVFATPVLAADTHAAHVHTAATNASSALAAVAVHTLAYLLVSGLVAWVVYTRLGVALLRTAWINLDAVWAAALIITGLVAALMT